MTAYYNEIDPKAAQWLRELIRAGHIADGVVDERSVEDIYPDDIREFTQCHFFAGIGVWSYALRQAGWPDDKPVWTGSCPCQPFSAAGKGAGFADERHLWPAWFHFITQCQPSVVFGEQVASKDGLAWLDLVQADMEGAGYASAEIDLCAAGIGAPHIRQRIFFVAEWLGDSEREGLEGQRGGYNAAQGHGERAIRPVAETGEFGGMADADGGQLRQTGPIQPSGEHGQQPQNRCAVRGESGRARADARSELDRPGPTNGLWRDADWLYCRDGKWRPVEPGTFPLANGAAARVGRLRGYGNAINAEVARIFIEAYMK